MNQDEKRRMIFQALLDLKQQEDKDTYCDLLLDVINILLNNIDNIDELLINMQNCVNPKDSNDCYCTNNQQELSNRTIHYPWTHKRELENEFIYFEIIDFLSGDHYDNNYTAGF